jgi:uncharacterized protein (TIGR02996 family)
MSSHKAFQAEILANPDDDAPRLVYADWLEDNGEADRSVTPASARERLRERFGPARVLR